MRIRTKFSLLAPDADGHARSSLVTLGNGVAVAHVDDDRPYGEVNPDTHLVSAQKSFWTHLEIEYKLEANSDREHCLEALRLFRARRYDVGELWTRTSYERYRRYSTGAGAQFHLVILGKRSWRLPMAMKYKIPRPHLYPSGFHVRSATIGPYSEKAAVRAACDTLRCTPRALRVCDLPAYYSIKTRRISLHRAQGLVYCISFGHARPLRESLPSRSQFEIEYWSRLLPAETAAALGSHLLYRSEFIALAAAFRRHLRRQGITAASTDVTRVRWLERLHDANS